MIVLQPRTRREVSYDANPTEWKQTGLPVLWAEHLAQSRYHDSEHDENKIDHFTVVCLVAWLLNESEAVVAPCFDKYLTAFVM